MTTESTKNAPVKKKNKTNYRNSPVIGDGGDNFNEGDNAKFIKHALANMNMPPIDIRDEVQVQERIAWYFNHCLEDDIKPTVGGLTNSLGISRDTLNKWKNGQSREGTHTDIIKKAYEFLNELWEHYMMNGKINPVSGIFLGKVMFGHKEEQHVVVEAKNTFNDYVDAKVIEERYEQLRDVYEDID